MSTEKLYEAVSDLSYVVENRYEKEFNVEGKNTEKTLPLYWIPEEKKTIRSCMKTEIQSMLAEISEEIKESIRGVVQVSDVVTFPVSVFDALEWKEGDSLDFKLQDDKTILITRVENATIEINQGELDPTTGS